MSATVQSYCNRSSCKLQNKKYETTTLTAGVEVLPTSLQDILSESSLKLLNDNGALMLLHSHRQAKHASPPTTIIYNLT